MSVSLNVIAGADQAVRQLRQAASAKKCHHCGCLHSTLKAIEEQMPRDARPAALDSVIADARAKLLDVKYDCLGCEVCWPANAVNALGIEGEACPAEPVRAQAGWPPLPGSYTVLRYYAPVAVCTLTDLALATQIAQSNASEIAITGTMLTENLGIERLIENVLANPNIRFLVVCGADSGQQIGHLAGQSLVALWRSGVDEQMKIIGARGKRPRIRNLPVDAVEHFRKTVEVIDMVNTTDAGAIRACIADCGARNPGPAEPYSSNRAVTRVRGYIPQRMTSDPTGYFVVYPDRARTLLILEHYRNDGVLDVVIEGTSAAELYIPAIERGLVSRLDHAAYLGRELARAERALATGESYVQDAASERGTTKFPGCECGLSCGERKP
ncbi:DUF4346 domain-containing protein [Fontivita pretiosa]|uniref:DUF4346 domain-containing protein n=1 Tax=Fontivita pretiosa TaxID=2989684 RepID=UPI003D1857BA